MAQRGGNWHTHTHTHTHTHLHTPHPPMGNTNQPVHSAIMVHPMFCQNRRFVYCLEPLLVAEPHGSGQTERRQLPDLIKNWMQQNPPNPSGSGGCMGSRVYAVGIRHPVVQSRRTARSVCHAWWTSAVTVLSGDSCSCIVRLLLRASTSAGLQPTILIGMVPQDVHNLFFVCFKDCPTGPSNCCRFTPNRRRLPPKPSNWVWVRDTSNFLSLLLSGTALLLCAASHTFHCRPRLCALSGYRLGTSAWSRAL